MSPRAILARKPSVLECEYGFPGLRPAVPCCSLLDRPADPHSCYPSLTVFAAPANSFGVTPLRGRPADAVSCQDILQRYDAKEVLYVGPADDRKNVSICRPHPLQSDVQNMIRMNMRKFSRAAAMEF